MIGYPLTSTSKDNDGLNKPKDDDIVKAFSVDLKQNLLSDYTQDKVGFKI